jgi:hypothetical protein
MARGKDETANCCTGIDKEWLEMAGQGRITASVVQAE